MEFLLFKTVLEGYLCCLYCSEVCKKFYTWKSLSRELIKTTQRFVFLELRCVLIVCNSLQAHSPKYVDNEVPGVFVLLLGCFIVVTLLMEPYHVQHMHVERS